MPRMAGDRFDKSRRNQLTERGAHDLLLSDVRYQRPDAATKRKILELLGKKGDFNERTFDLVVTPAEVETLTLDNVARHIDRITLVEVKSTKQAIRDVGLARFFYGTTERQRQLALALPDRYRYAFVVLNSNNVYGRPFFTLLTPAEVEDSIYSDRVQHQVDFRANISADDLPGREPSFEITGDLARVAHAEADETTEPRSGRSL